MHVQPFHGLGTWSSGFVTQVKDGSVADDSTCLHVADKEAADCVESLIGTILINCGRVEAIKLMQFLGLRVTNFSLNQLCDRKELCDREEHWIEKEFVSYNQELAKDPIQEKVAKETIPHLYTNSCLD